MKYPQNKQVLQKKNFLTQKIIYKLTFDESTK